MLSFLCRSLPLLLVPSLLGASEVSEKPTLLLSVGEQRLLNVPGLQHYSLGSSGVRSLPWKASRTPHSPDSPYSGDALLLKAVSPGISDLWIWKRDGSQEHHPILVEKEPLLPGLKPELARGLSELNEVEVMGAGAQVILQGEIRSPSELSRIEALERAFPEAVRNETYPSDALLERGRTALAQWIPTTPWKDRLRLERRDRQLWLMGNSPIAADAEMIRRRARSLFPGVRLDIQALPDDSPTVHFKVFLLEVRKNQFGQLGLGWPASQEAAFKITTSGIEDAVALEVAIHAMEGDGSAKVLSNPELVVRAPGDAELFSGGELPIHTQSHYFSDITWKNFGLSLKLKVSHTTAERVRLEIFTEVSRLDPTLLTDNKIPGLQSNRMRTQVDARYGTPLLLSGLLQDSARRTAQGLPLLREIPVLGTLFGSDDWLNEKSELVAILVPSLVPPAAPMERIPVPIRELTSTPPKGDAHPAMEAETGRAPPRDPFDLPGNGFGERQGFSERMGAARDF